MPAEQSGSLAGSEARARPIIEYSGFQCADESASALASGAKSRTDGYSVAIVCSEEGMRVGCESHRTSVSCADEGTQMIVSLSAPVQGPLA